MTGRTMGWMFIVAALSVAGFRCGYAQEEGLVGYWNFDEGSGAIAHDKSGKENNGKMSGAQYVKEGMNGALQFNDKGDTVDCGNSASLNLENAFTIEAWVKTPLSDIRVSLVAKESAYSVSLFETPGPDKLVNLYGHTYSATRRPNEYYLSKGLPLGKWCHVAAAWDGKNVKGYVNGEYTGYSLPTVAPMDISAKPMMIGGAYTPGFNYMMDEVRIYNRALPDADIKKQYEDTKKYFEATSDGQEPGKTATVAISDWADDKTPGGKIGQELMFNFVRVQPYLEE